MDKRFEKPFRLGVALSGGGARGFAHAGALAAIEEAGLKPDVLAGVSAGSIAAALYSAGVRPHEFLEIFSKRTIFDFAGVKPQLGALLSMQPFKKLIKKSLGKYNLLEELPIPVYIGVTDFDHGIATEFHTGDIADCVMASSTVPIVFKPVKINDTNYIDGGAMRNHPAWIIRDKCDLLIGVNCSPMVGDKVNTNSLISVAIHSFNILYRANQTHDMDLCDISIEPKEIAHHGTFDLRYIKEVYKSGYDNTRQALIDAGLWSSQI